jgi:hypothetical protein
VQVAFPVLLVWRMHRSFATQPQQGVISMPTQKFLVQGLRHEDEAALAGRIRELPGVFFALLDHEEQCADVEYEDDRVTGADICAAIRTFGYEARAVS